MSDFVPTGKRLRILQLLIAHGELTGGEILDLDDALSRGTIYTTLRRLQDARFVASRQKTEKGQAGPPRRYYTITATGALAVRASEVAAAVMSGATKLVRA